jgi:hypothetical protein
VILGVQNMSIITWSVHSQGRWFFHHAVFILHKKIESLIFLPTMLSFLCLQIRESSNTSIDSYMDIETEIPYTAIVRLSYLP